MLLQFGGGNIGRSFIGALFARAGYKVVFVDTVPMLVEALNRERAYTVNVLDKVREVIEIKNVTALLLSDIGPVLHAIIEADICGTAVGVNALKSLVPIIAEGLLRRYQAKREPIDIILCENLRGAANLIRRELQTFLPPEFPLDGYVGLVETSVGKMVPLVSVEQRARDFLAVYAESYNSLIVDKKGFINPIPCVDGLVPKSPIVAWVERKAFIHNLGHSALAYFARFYRPKIHFTWEAVEDPEIRCWTKKCMEESRNLLLKKYPKIFRESELNGHIEELLERFANRYLGDTLYRVGRDLRRKLSANDRLAGSIKEAVFHGLNTPWTIRALACGLFFHPGSGDESFEDDIELRGSFKNHGIERFLKEHCQLPVFERMETLRVYNQLKNGFVTCHEIWKDSE